MTEEGIIKLEKLLGGRIERKSERKVPGTIDISHRKFIYFSDNKKKHKFRTQFRALTHFVNPPNGTHGGIGEAGCKITTPDGALFYAISYHGDLEGNKKDIEGGAEGLGLLLACIEGDNFIYNDKNDHSCYLPKTDKKFFDNNKLIISDGRSFLLSECDIELY
jgi:hypothetical protein